MPSVLPARVEKLAPTGEGVVRTNEGVGLVSGALPGEDVDVEVVRVTRKIWWGRALAIRSPAPSRLSSPHAAGCPACDWAHVDLAAARAFKHALFFETMERIGKLDRSRFGAVEPEVVPSPSGYRLRVRLHVGRSADGHVVAGAHAPGTHAVVPLDGCEALSDGLRAQLPRIAAAIDPDEVAELAVVEALDGSRRLARAARAARTAGPREPDRPALNALDTLFDGLTVADGAGHVLRRSGEERLWLPVGPGGRDVPAAPDAFFQANRFLVAPLADHVRDLASEAPAGTALDAFGGSGLFAASLLDAGHRVTTVEGSREAVRSASLARERWKTAVSQWRIESSSVLAFAARERSKEDVVVADPPRAGLGAPLARALAARARRRLIYVSCDPATLARDLAVLLEAGLEIRSTRLFDLFAWTHRVEAVIALDRVSGA